MAFSIPVGVKDEKNAKGEWVWKGLSLMGSAGKRPGGMTQAGWSPPPPDFEWQIQRSIAQISIFDNGQSAKEAIETRPRSTGYRSSPAYTSRYPS